MHLIKLTGNIMRLFSELGINGESEPKALNLMSPTRLSAATQLPAGTGVQLSANALQNVLQVGTVPRVRSHCASVHSLTDSVANGCVECT